MKLIIQNVDSASVEILNDDENQNKKESIWKWVLIYFWVSRNTTQWSLENVKMRIDKFVEKMQRMRWLKNDEWRLDATIHDIKWEILVVSNFTLYAGNKKGTKMDFSASGEYNQAKIIYDYFLEKLLDTWISIKSGEFGWMMKVESINDGPINYILEI